MPEPITTSELLLQKIADDLKAVRVALEPKPAAPVTPAKKAASSKTRKAVDGR